MMRNAITRKHSIASRRLGAILVMIGLMAGYAGAAQADTREVVVYPGFGASRFVVEGRVIEARAGRPEAQDNSWFTNLRRTLRRLINDEQGNVSLRVRLGTGEWRVHSDAEGYFRVEAQTPPGMTAGWQVAEVATESGDAKAGGAVLLVPADNRLGIITDLDDTILISDVTDRSRLVRKTLFENYAQRHAVAGTAKYFSHLVQRNPQPAAAPLFYLSASPRQLHTGIQTFLDRNGFPGGVLITRKITNDQTGDPLTDPVRYKITRIEQLLTVLPQVRFVLVGDDGERDPEIYDEIHRRHPERIEAVWIRRVSQNSARPVYAGQGDLASALDGGRKE